MNRIAYLLIGFVSACSLLLWTSGVFSKGNEDSEGLVNVYCQSTEWSGIGASRLIGHRVYSPAGGELGQVSDLLIDRFDGHILLVILSDVPGFGSEFVAAPFSALEKTGQRLLQLNLGDRHIPMASAYEDPYASELARHRNVVGLSIIPSAIDSVWADSVYRFYGQTPYWRAEPHMVILSYRAAEPSTGESWFAGRTSWTLMGAKIWSGNEKPVARLDDLVLDLKNGRVVLLVIDQIPGRGDAQVAVPFDELSMSGKPFALRITEDRLASAPGFRESVDANDRRKVEDVYRHFGLLPSWTGEGGRIEEIYRRGEEEQGF
jgi:sporulation protein YlmC with PRC-barrel domain